MIFGVIPFVKLQLGYKTTLKQQLNGQKQKWSEKLNHVSVFGWAVVFLSSACSKHRAGKQHSSSKNT